MFEKPYQCQVHRTWYSTEFDGSQDFSNTLLMCLIFSRSPKREGRRPSFHSRLPLPVIFATAPGVFAERRVRCRTSRCRNTHFGFPVGVGDFAKVPGGVLTTPGSGEDSLRGVLTLPASWISCEQYFIAKCVLTG